MKATIVLLTLVLASVPAYLEAQSFSDDFNRPDSATVGNGWLDSPNNSGGNLSIRSGQLTTTGNSSAAGIYRSFPFDAPVSVSATLAETSGFGGLPRQYSAGFAIRSDGALETGYWLNFSRSDINYNDSAITLRDGATVIASFHPIIQFGALLELHITFGVDGSIVGTVGQNGQSESFSFPAHAIQSTGAYFLIYVSAPDGRAANPIFHRLDDLTISAQSIDSDGDGVTDDTDQCPNTPAGAVVDADGCSIDQLVPCAGPRTGGTWRNHGQYVSSLAKAAEAFLAAGLITEDQKDAIVEAAAQSNCGKK